MTKPISPDCLKAVAQISFSISNFASLLNKNYKDFDDANIQYFIQTTKQLFWSDIKEHSTSNGPVWFLICFIVRHFGLSFLLKLADLNSKFRWILPVDELKQVY